MLTKFVIKPYKLGSLSAKKLAMAISDLVGYKVKRVRGHYIPRRNERVIHWGQSMSPYADSKDSNVNISTALNKLDTFKMFSSNGVSCPEWTTSRQQAQEWANSGQTVVVRKLLSSKGGAGIVLVESGAVPNAPLYTKYKKKAKEFRVHVVMGKVVEIVEKRKKSGSVCDSRIRNHSNGWVFCKENVVAPDDLKEVAVKAVEACGLQFGAVDIIWNQKENKSYALEVNTAPGFEGSTVMKYAKAFVESQNV